MTVYVNENAPLDVVGIGSALLDIIVEVDDSFLDDLKLKKGQMHLIDEETSRSIQEKIKDMPVEIAPGGSAANTLAGIVTLGGASLLLGAVGNDEHGSSYIEESEKQGMITSIEKKNCLTGHAITFVTPDSERTFATHLGAALEFDDNDIPDGDIARGKILHLEGYLFEADNLYFACRKAMHIARTNGMAVSLALSDPAQDFFEANKKSRFFRTGFFLSIDLMIIFSRKFLPRDRLPGVRPGAI